jgi:hypothetical protein
MSPVVALFGHGAMSGLSPECASKQTSADQSKFLGSRPRLPLSCGQRGR